MPDNLDPLVTALLGLSGDRGHARAAIDALGRDGDLLAAAIARHLGTPGRDGVYVEPDGFRRFISGGGNVPLYAATSAALARRLLAIVVTQPTGRYSQGTFRLLDVGTGDGRAVIPAVEGLPAPIVIDAVEPSTELRSTLAAAVAGSAHAWRLHGETVQRFLTGSPGPWELAQSTFALHNLNDADLAATLALLRERVRQLVVVEFDVPRFADQRDPDRVAYCVDRYRAGIAEYADALVVVDGFLVPVLLGGLDERVPQTTFERPAQSWVEALGAAGFGRVDVQPVFDYWWAPAVVLTAWA